MQIQRIITVPKYCEKISFDPNLTPQGFLRIFYILIKILQWYQPTSMSFTNLGKIGFLSTGRIGTSGKLSGTPICANAVLLIFWLSVVDASIITSGGFFGTLSSP